MSTTAPGITGERIKLGGIEYVIVRASEFDRLCAMAESRTTPGVAKGLSSWVADGGALARRMAQRRRKAGLSQAELARRAGVRPETLNRVERGKVTPDFATIRKLVVAIEQHARQGVPT